MISYFKAIFSSIEFDTLDARKIFNEILTFFFVDNIFDFQLLTLSLLV